MPATVEALLPHVENTRKVGYTLKFDMNKQQQKSIIFKEKVKAELEKLDCTEEEIKEFLTEEVIKEAMRNGFSAEAVAWALVQ